MGTYLMFGATAVFCVGIAILAENFANTKADKWIFGGTVAFVLGYIVSLMGY